MPLYLQEITICCPNGSALLWSGPPPPARQPPYAGNREVIGPVPGKEVHIDGFNIIITLEIALSGSTLLKCMDGTIRDLAGLRGTYRIIGKTHEAIRLLLCRLKELEAERAVFYLDSPCQIQDG